MNPLEEPKEWKAREHLGADLKGLSRIDRQIIAHFDVLLQRFDWVKIRTQWALGLSIVNFILLSAFLVAVAFKSPEVVSLVLKKMLGL